jgi:hypothetical protein
VRLTSAKSEHGKASPEPRAPANLASFAILFIAASNRYQALTFVENAIPS